MTADIETTREGRVLHIRLARAAKRNAITQAMYAALADTLTAAEDDGTVVVTISGDGNIFCSGNDLIDFVAVRPDGVELPVHRFLRAIACSTRILIAAVQGRAVGVGATMLLHCDFVLAEPDAVLSFPFVELALVPEAASSLLLPRRIGHLRAAEAFMLCEPISAARADTLGLVTAIVGTGTGRHEIGLLAARLLEKPEGALLATKRLMRSATEDVMRRMTEETQAFAARLQSPELHKAVEKFFATRGKAA